MWIHYSKFAWRAVAGDPRSSLFIVLVLAVGIGANASVFGVLDAVLLDSLSYPAPDRLVAVWETNSELGRDHEGPSPANLLDWRDRNDVFSGIAASYPTPVTRIGQRDSVGLLAARVTGEFFAVLGTTARYGRTFSPQMVDRNRRVMVLSHRTHQGVFGGDPEVIGRHVVIDGEDYSVVGVMPPGFVHPGRDAAIWLPWDPRSAYADRSGPPRDFRFLNVVARLRPGVRIDMAQARLESIARDLAAKYPESNAGWSVRLVPLRDEIVGDVGRVLWILFGAVSFVLMVCCANAAALMLARAFERQHEMVMRRVMGATPAALISLGLWESFVLGAIGGLAGLALAHAVLTGVIALHPGNLPRIREVGIDGSVLAFTAMASIFALALAGTLPALLGAQANPAHQLRSGESRGVTSARSIRRALRALVVGELATALVLLVGAGLLVRSYAELQAVDPGFDPRGVLVAQMNLEPDRYDPAETRAYYARFLQSAMALPGVESAGAVSALPMNPVAIDFDRPFWLPGSAPIESERPEAAIRIATPGYFTAMGMVLAKGRAFDETDTEGGEPVAIVNQTLAQRLWQNKSPIDRRLVIDYRGTRSYRVVGVVRDTRFNDVRSGPGPEIFLPHAQVPYLPMSVAMRTHRDPSGLSSQVRRLAREIDPAQPVHSTVTLNELVSDSMARERFAMGLLTSLAGAALLLAVTGIYGLMTFSVRHRKKEIGLRLALGASHGSILWMILAESLGLIAFGAAIGLVLSLGLTGLLSQFLFGIGAFNGTTYLVASVVLGGATILASLPPARLAMRFEPATLLRNA